MTFCYSVINLTVCVKSYMLFSCCEHFCSFLDAVDLAQILHRISVVLFDRSMKPG